MDVSTVLSLQRFDKKSYISEDRNALPILNIISMRGVCENFYINLTRPNKSSISRIFPRTDIKNTIVNRSYNNIQQV